MSGRRVSAVRPRFAGRPPHEWGRDLEESFRRMQEANDDGIPPGFQGNAPSTIQAGVTADPGEETSGWEASGHVHEVETATAVSLGSANSEGTGAPLARADHVHKRDLGFQANGSVVAIRGAVDLSEQPGITISGSDDPGGDIVHYNVGVTNPPTTKGDLWTHNGANPARLPAGADGTVNVYDSGGGVGGSGIAQESVATLLARLLTSYGLIGHDGATPVYVSFGSTGHPLWIDDRQAAHIHAGQQGGHPWLGRWLVDTPTDATATEIFRVTVGPDAWSAVGFHIMYSVEVDYGNDQQVEAGSFHIAASVSGTGTLAATAGATFGVAQRLTAGTLTVTPSVSVSGNDVVVKLAVNSSLGTPYDFCAIHSRPALLGYDFSVTFP